jgi:integrase
MRKEVISYPEFHDVLMQLKNNGKKDLVNYLYLSIMFVTGARGNTIRKLKFKDFRAERGTYVLQYHETKTNKVSVTEIPEELFTDVMLFRESKCNLANSS